RAVADAVARRVVVGYGIGGGIIGVGLIAHHDLGDVAARHNHLGVGVAAGVGAAAALGEAGGEGQGGILHRGVVLVDAGIEDTDLDAGARVGLPAHQVPRGGSVHQLGRLVEREMYLPHGAHAEHARDGGQF